MEFFEKYTRSECIIKGEDLKKIASFCSESDCVMIVSKGGLMVINTYKGKALYTDRIQTTIRKFIAFQSNFLNCYDIDVSQIHDRDLYVLVFDKEEGHLVIETVSGNVISYVSGKVYKPPE